MGSVGADGSRARPSVLLERLGEGKFHEVGSYWRSVSQGWDEEDTYRDIRMAIGKYPKQQQDVANEKKNDRALLDELKDILAYDDRELRLESKKIQLLDATITDFNKKNVKRTKNPKVEEELEIACMVVKAMCLLHPKIAFEPCPDDNTEEPTAKLSAFQSAAKSGSKRILEIILDALLASIECEKTTGSGTGDKTVSRTTAEKSMTEVVELLLKTFASLPLDVRKKAMDVFKLMVEKNKSLLNETTWKLSVKTPSPVVVDYLLKMRDSKFCTKEHAGFVVNEGTGEMWEMFPEESRHEFLSAPECNLLHKAVSLGKVDVVEAILKQRPAQIEVSTGEVDFEYPLQHLKKLRDSAIKTKEDSYGKIRDLLLHAMIRSENLGIQNIRDTLRRSEVEANEMSFHFPQFKSDTKNESSTDYVRGLKKINPHLFRFEKVLKYANFPDLNSQAPFMGSEDLKQDHREVKEVFEWLGMRGVQEVMNLSVDDRLHCPHDDDDVAYCVNTFGVRVLKWRKLDIYLKNLADSLIEELHLYSSGNRSVHDQWLSQLPKFKRLRRLYVYVVKDVLNPRRVKEVSEELQNKLNELNGCREKEHKWTSGEDMNEGDPDDDRKLEVSQIFWIQQRETIAYRSLDNITSDLVGPHLAAFIKKFCSYYKEHRKTTKTKVALIDSGVVVVGGARGQHSNNEEFGSDLAKRIVDGTSLVSRDNEEQAWWHATEPHGTQMATLICSINPCCDLYVVKVAESNASGITGHNVAKAIDWARSKGVDIISLSLVTFSDPKNDMAKAIKAARQDDIVITCSTADEGSIGAHSVGEENRNVLSIAACDKWGNLLPESQKRGFNYQFIGQNVRVGQVPYLKSDESIKGSSVSTAVAAGMASLILACARISSNFHGKDSFSGDQRLPWRFDTVTDTFGKMVEGKWVVLDQLCGKGALENRYDFERLVNETFKS